MENPRKKIKITRKERESGMIDKSKIAPSKTMVIKLNKPTGKSGGTLDFKHGAVKKTFQKQDVRTGDPNYGKESATKPTPEFVKKAQSAGAEHAEREGKSYAAGKATHVKNPDTHIKIKIHPEMKMVVRKPSTASETGAGKEDIHQKNSPGPKRRLERVAWLKGRNKRTEAGH